MQLNRFLASHVLTTLFYLAAAIIMIVAFTCYNSLSGLVCSFIIWIWPYIHINVFPSAFSDLCIIHASITWNRQHDNPSIPHHVRDRSHGNHKKWEVFRCAIGFKKVTVCQTLAQCYNTIMKIYSCWNPSKELSTLGLCRIDSCTLCISDVRTLSRRFTDTCKECVKERSYDWYS